MLRACAPSAELPNGAESAAGLPSRYIGSPSPSARQPKIMLNYRPISRCGYPSGLRRPAGQSPGLWSSLDVQGGGTMRCGSVQREPTGTGRAGKAVTEFAA